MAAARIAAQAKAVTFKQAAERYFEAHQKSWTNARHAAEFLSSLSRWAYPFIGGLDVSAIDMTLVLRVLEQPLPRDAGTFWLKHVVTADRVRSRMERTLDFSTVRGWRSGDNPARWKGFLAEALPAPRKISPVKNHAAVPFEDIPALMAATAIDPDVGAQALRFLILTAARLSEVRTPAVGEIDFEAAEWRIPAPRMKGFATGFGPSLGGLRPSAREELAEGIDSCFACFLNLPCFVESLFLPSLKQSKNFEVWNTRARVQEGCQMDGSINEQETIADESCRHHSEKRQLRCADRREERPQVQSKETGREPRIPRVQQKQQTVRQTWRRIAVAQAVSGCMKRDAVVEDRRSHQHQEGQSWLARARG
jgi:hypothetical protein